jgi:hypothetical protein
MGDALVALRESAAKFLAHELHHTGAELMSRCGVFAEQELAVPSPRVPNRRWRRRGGQDGRSPQVR